VPHTRTGNPGRRVFAAIDRPSGAISASPRRRPRTTNSPCSAASAPFGLPFPRGPQVYVITEGDRAGDRSATTVLCRRLLPAPPQAQRLWRPQSRTTDKPCRGYRYGWRSSAPSPEYLWLISRRPLELFGQPIRSWPRWVARYPPLCRCPRERSPLRASASA